MRFKEYKEQVRLATIDFVVNNYSNTEINQNIIIPNYTFNFWNDFIEDGLEDTNSVDMMCNRIREYITHKLSEGVNSLSFNDLWRSLPNFRDWELFDSFDGEGLRVLSIDFKFLFDNGTKWENVHLVLDDVPFMTNVFEWDDNQSDAVLWSSYDINGTIYYCGVSYLLEDGKISITLTPPNTDDSDWDWDNSLSNGKGFKLGDEVTFNLTNGDSIVYKC